MNYRQISRRKVMSLYWQVNQRWGKGHLQWKTTEMEVKATEKLPTHLPTRYHPIDILEATQIHHVWTKLTSVPFHKQKFSTSSCIPHLSKKYVISLTGQARDLRVILEPSFSLLFKITKSCPSNRTSIIGSHHPIPPCYLDMLSSFPNI